MLKSELGPRIMTGTARVPIVSKVRGTVRTIDEEFHASRSTVARKGLEAFIRYRNIGVQEQVENFSCNMSPERLSEGEPCACVSVADT